MALGRDRVLVLKMEVVVLGGDSGDEFHAPATIRELQDFLSSSGFVLQDGGQTQVASDEAVAVFRDGAGKMVGHDQVHGSPGSPLEVLDKRLRVSSDDTTAAYLEDKIDASGDLIANTLNPGADETLQLLVNVGQAFAADFLQTSVFRTTSIDTDPQDLFDPLSPSDTFLQPSVDGDYLVLIKADARVTNSNGSMAIGVAKTSVITANEESASITLREGQSQGSSTVLFRLNGLTTSDKIYGWFRKEAGAGDAEVFNRAMLILRLG